MLLEQILGKVLDIEMDHTDLPNLLFFNLFLKKKISFWLWGIIWITEIEYIFIEIFFFFCEPDIIRLVPLDCIGENSILNDDKLGDQGEDQDLNH